MVSCFSIYGLDNNIRIFRLLHKCYFDNRDIYDLRRGWYVEREVPEEYDEDGNLIEHVGYIATEDQVKEMEKTGKAVKKRLYCIHPPKLDVSSEVIRITFKYLKISRVS